MVRFSFTVLLVVVVPSGSSSAQAWPAWLSVDDAVVLALQGYRQGR
jgi:hypothetical protein